MTDPIPVKVTLLRRSWFFKATFLAAVGVGIAIVYVGGSFIADQFSHGFLNKVFTYPTGRKFKYILFVPHDYHRWKEAYPVLVSLHGVGKAGTDGLFHIEDGPAKHIKKMERNFNFITIFPQGRTGHWAPDSDDTRLVMDILADVEKAYNVDSNRIFLTGISSGGAGVWNLAAHYPVRWAAIVPIAGSASPHMMNRVKHIPCWCFHGVNDQVTPIEDCRELMSSLKAVGGSPKYTEYVGFHNVWDQAYANQELYDWLLQQRLP